MAVTSAAGAQSSSGGLWAQIQSQQARQNADRAEQHAAELQAKAQSAQTVADRAQASARSLQAASRQAKGEASQARLNLAGRNSASVAQAPVADSRAQVGKLPQSNSLNAVANPKSLAPVVNSSGQQTGRLVNVTA